MSQNFEITAKLDTTLLEEQEASWKLRLRTLNQDITRIRAELRTTQLYAFTVMGGVASILSTIASSLPGPLRIIGQSVVNVINAVIQAVMITAMTYTTAAGANPIFSIQAAFAWAGVAIAVAGVGYAIQNQQRLDNEVTRFQAGINQTLSSFTGMLRALGGY